MNAATVQRILGLLLMMFSSTLLAPFIVSLIFHDGTLRVFFESFLILAGSGFALWWPARNNRREMRLRDGFLVVALFWIVLGLFGSAPFLLAPEPRMSFTDAVFESISGLTTTGATVLTGLDSLPPAIQFYRQQLQWLGGLGIIVLAVAVLPTLGVGGMQLYRAETPGPLRENRLTPRIEQTAKALWYVYAGITCACGFAYWIAGMSPFDAICHAFSTVAIGGFSTHDASIGYFASPAIEFVAATFMFLAGVNFALHFLSWKERSLLYYFKDPEFRAYVTILLGLAVSTIIYLLWHEVHGSPTESISKALFHVVSIATTTGFTTDNFASWPDALPVLLIFSSFVGGCVGSTAGGMKVMRWALMYAQGTREFRRLVHPRAEIAVKLGTKVVAPRVVESVWSFFAIYIVVFTALILIMLATGMDHTSAFSAVAATLNNLGPGLGDVATGFGDVPLVAKWSSICAMLLGRLEIFALLLLFTPTFWRS